MNKNLEPEYSHDGSFEQRFFALFTRIARLLRQHCEPTTTGHTLSAAQLRYLYLLEHAGAPQPISYFADGVFSNRSNATQMIDRLQGEGLVSRIKNPRDRRSVLVELTELGSQRLREGNEWLVGLLEALFDPMGDEERDATIRVLERVLRLLEDEQRRMDQELSNNTS